jgi:antitoxin HicB
MKKKKRTRSTDELTMLDDFLKQEGRLEEFEAVAIKEVLAWQIAVRQ